MALTQIEQGMLKDGILTADAAGRLKMADGFVNAAKLGAGAARANWGAGGVLQVVQYVYTAATTLDTGDNHVALPGLLGDGTIVITPSSASSKILIMSNIHQGHEDTWKSHNFRINRKIGAGAYNAIANYAYNDYNAGRTTGGGSTTNVWLDSPATTSVVAYKYEARRGHSSSNFMRFNVNSYAGSYVNEAYSTITLLEIAG